MADKERTARHRAKASSVDNEVVQVEVLDEPERDKPEHDKSDRESQSPKVESRGTYGKHGKVKEGEQLPVYVRRSRRMRHILTVVIVIGLILLLIGGYLVYQLLTAAQNVATEQSIEHEQSQDVSAIYDADAKDATTVTEKTATVPDLAGLLGLTEEQAIAAVGMGAQVLSARDLDEPENPIRREVRLALTEEPSDPRIGTPTVYLSLNEAGQVIQAGYSTSTTSLGYGAVSFTDAVKAEKIVETTMAEAGVTLPADAVQLPQDRAEYSTYSADGTTLVREYYSFSGEVTLNDVSQQWSAVLSYDYSMANASGNLSDTVRTIYIYIGV